MAEVHRGGGLRLVPMGDPKLMQYERYRPAVDQMTRSVREALVANKHEAKRLFGKPLKKVAASDLRTVGFKYLLESMRDSGNLLGQAALLDEIAWDESGRTIYFPMPGLVESLYRANIKIDDQDFVLPAKSFAVSIPKGTTVGGIPVRAFLASSGTHEERRLDAERLSRRTGIKVDLEFAGADVGPCIHISTVVPRTAAGVEMFRFSSPQSMVREILQAQGEIGEADAVRLFGTYAQAIPLTDQEAKECFVILKTLVHLAVYMRSFPGSIREGYPEQFSHDCRIDGCPATVGGEHFGGTHASPHGHWRTWHFRSFPSKKDGTKKPGLVHVSEAWVGAETPKTVEAVNA